MGELDWFAWAAGVFEGEGYVLHYSNGRGSKNRALGIAMTDRDVVERFCAAVGVGTVTGPWDNGPRCKPIWRWRVGGWEKVKPLAERLEPYLGERRGAAVNALLADPPTEGKWKDRCGCGERLVVMFKSDRGRRRCPKCRKRKRAKIG